MGSASKSPWLIHYDGSSCNGCDIEVLDSLTPLYDIERFGIINTGNPKHADIFLVTGSVNAQNRDVVRQIYDQMLEPKVVVACGVCACTGGVFRECYNVLGGVDQAIPVDVYAPGCAVRPETIIDAVLQGVEILDQKAGAPSRSRHPERSAEGAKSKDPPATLSPTRNPGRSSVAPSHSRHPERSRVAETQCHPERSRVAASHPCHPVRSTGTASHPCHPERSAEGAKSKDLPTKEVS